MSDDMTSSSHAPDTTLAAGESRQGWVSSLAFWICLLFSAALYSSIALSPKLLAYLTLRQECDTHQLKLVGLEKQISHIQKVIDALKHDPSFARELARIDFDAVKSDEERIPVDSSLTQTVRPGAADLDVAPPDLPWFTPILRLLAYSRPVGNIVLAISAIVILYAFTCLGERGFRRIDDPNVLREAA